MYEAFGCKLSHNLSGYLGGHSCCSALLKMTEDWRASLDRREAIAAVALDLSKAFDSVSKIVRQFGLSALTNWHVFHNNNEALDQLVKQMIWY